MFDVRIDCSSSDFNLYESYLKYKKKAVIARMSMTFSIPLRL